MQTPQRADNIYFVYQWAVLSIALLILCGFIIYTQSQDYRRINAQERERLTKQAEIVEKNLAPQLVSANLVIDGILNNLTSWRAENDGYKHADRLLKILDDAMVQISPILVIQADGKVIASSNEQLVGRNFSYREYFKTAVQNPDPNVLHVSAPYHTVLDTFVVSLFRCIPGPHGRFAGIVIVSVIPEAFSILLDSVRYAPDMQASIIHGDGKLFLTSPKKVGMAGINLAKPGTFFTRHRESGQTASVFTGTDYLTGEDRISVLRTIKLTTPPMDRPLFVEVSRNYDALFAPWRKSVYAQSMLFGVIALLSTLGLYSTQRKRREQLLERRQAEEKLRKLSQAVEQSPALIVITDRSGDIEYVNPAFCAVTGYLAEDIMGQNPRFLKTGQTSAEAYQHLWETITGGETWQGEFCNRKKNGELIWGSACIAPVYDNHGTITHFVAIEEDISERKRQEDEKTKLEDQLQQAQKMEAVGRLAGGVAHDFNNMLTVILGHANLALMKIDSTQPLHINLEEIRKAAERSAGLTRQLLAFARKQTIAPKVLDVNEAVVGTINMLQRLLGEDIHLTWQPGGNLWQVKVDPSQIDQILANLCVNARDAIANIGKITIATGNCTFDSSYCAINLDARPGEYVRIAVSDDGSGMDKETLSHIFEPFFTTKGVGKGTGLGLATVYGIVRQNNGFINVYSEPGIGTKFTIYLPRHEGNLELAKNEGVPGPGLYGSETILLVEDEPAILTMTAIMLENLGYTVLVSNSPEEAIHLTREQAGKIDLLITDVIMPEMNGRDLARELLSFCPSLKSLYMSGYTSNVIAHHGVLEEGFNFIEKPFSMSDLAAKVRHVLDSK